MAFIVDSLTEVGTGAVNLNSHIGEVGAAWTQHPHVNYAGGPLTLDADSDRVYGTGTNASYASGIPPSADYSFEADFFLHSAISQNIAICVRMDTTADTMVSARLNNGATWEVREIVAGAATPLGSSTNQIPSVGTAKRGRLEVRGNQAYFYVENVLEIGPVTVTVLTTGRAGIRNAGAASATTGIHLDNLSANSLYLGASLFRGRYFPLFDDEEVNRFEFWPAVTAGGQLFTQDLSGALSPSSLLLESVSKPLIGSLSPSAVLVKTTGSSVTGILNPTGLVVQQPSQTFTGSDAPLGDLFKRANRILAASLNSSGTVSEESRKSLSGSLSASGGMLNSVQSAFSAMISPTAALSSLRSALLSVAGTVSPSGALTKRVDNVFSGVASVPGVIAHQVERVLTGAISPSAALAQIKIALLSLAGSISSSGELARGIERMFLALTVSAGSLSNQTQRILGGVSNPTATLSSIKILMLSLIGAVAPSGATLKSIHAMVVGAFTGAGEVMRRLARVFDGAATPTSVVASLKIVLLVLAGSILPLGLRDKRVGYQGRGELTPTGIISSAIGKVLSASLSLGGVATKQGLKLMAGILTTTGSVISSLAVMLRIIKQPTSVKLSSDGKSQVSISTGTTSVTVSSGELDVSIDS